MELVESLIHFFRVFYASEANEEDAMARYKLKLLKAYLSVCRTGAPGSQGHLRDKRDTM